MVSLGIAGRTNLPFFLMGLSTKLHRALTLERSLPSRTFPKTLNRQQAAFYSHMTGEMYAKLQKFPMTSEGKVLLDSMETAIQIDRGNYSDALRNDELRFVEAMSDHLHDLDDAEMGAFWFTTVIGDVADAGKKECDIQFVYHNACSHATPEYLKIAETSFDVVTYHWSAEMKKECIKSVEHAWKHREMVLYALENIQL